MTTFDKIFSALWFLPSFTGAFIVLSSEICSLNNWSAFFISLMFYLISIANQIQHDKLDNKIENLEKQIKELQK